MPMHSLPCGLLSCVGRTYFAKGKSAIPLNIFLHVLYGFFLWESIVLFFFEPPRSPYKAKKRVCLNSIRVDQYTADSNTCPKMKKIRRTCIIDDDEILVFLAKRLLKNSGICDDFLLYHDGAEAITGLSQVQMNNEIFPDLILLDINMPEMDGWEFLDSLQEIEITELPPIFIMTTSIDPRDFERAKKLEMVTEYIVKPLDIKVIANLISRINK